MLFKPRLPAFCCRKTHLIRLARTVTSMQQCHARVITGGHLLKGPGYRFENTLLSVSGDHFLQQRSDLQEEVEPLLQAKVGRLLTNKMPTGVIVSPAMMHGGPFPASGHPGFTAVGLPASLLRFAARRCYERQA